MRNTDADKCRYTQIKSRKYSYNIPMPTPEFPGRLIKLGETDAGLVTSIQKAMRLRGYGPFNAGQFDAQMRSVVMTFQSQTFDVDGHSLVVDGEIGIYTWGVLFPSPPVAPGT